jgi:hypothetical protein
MSQPDNLGGKFPEHVYAALSGTRGTAAATTTPATFVSPFPNLVSLSGVEQALQSGQCWR